MIPPRFLLGRALAAAFFGLVALPFSGSAQDLTPPVVKKPLSDLTVPVGTTATTIKLNKTFALTGVTGELVRFSTSVGNLDVEIFTQQTPQTAAAFLKYAKASGDNTTGTYSYTNTLIQRVYDGFVGAGGGDIVQGGGFFIDGKGTVNQIVGRPTIPGEAGIPNTRGTLAMALSNGPDSATGDFYFNGGDNPELNDATDGGPFTVFGRVVGSMATLEAIEALPRQNLSTQLGSAFEDVPLVDYTPGSNQSLTVKNLVYTNSIVDVPLISSTDGGAALLKLKVKNNNPALLTATVTGKKLKLVYKAGQTGKANIKVLAIDSAGSQTKSRFTVTVQ